jgi:NitT/TauT family transport system substrate-binding protein
MTRFSLSRRAALGGLAAAAVAGSARAQTHDPVQVGVLRFVSSGPLFLALERGHFRNELIEVTPRFFEAAQPIAVATASGDVQLGLTAFTAGFYNLAGRGALKIIAAQAKEQRGFEGNAFLVSNAAYERGFRAVEAVAGKSFAITQLGSSFHYQIGQIARVKGFELRSVDLRPLQSLPNMVAALRSGQVDAMIIAPHIARSLVAQGQAKHLAWYSEFDEYQFGALFTATRATTERREFVQRFVHAYQEGCADYAAAFLRRDAQGRRLLDEGANDAAAIIARYVYPNEPEARGVELVKAASTFIDEKARLDVGDIHRQVAWMKEQSLVDRSADARAMLDLGFIEGHTNIPG